MNKARRTKIDELSVKLEDIRAEIEMLHDAEEEAFNNLPEGIQSSERGELMDSAISSLEQAHSAIEEAMDALMVAAE
ncbi:MAG: hypothetical protein ABIE47_05920 [Pseudomonadota bacterium]